MYMLTYLAVWRERRRLTKHWIGATNCPGTIHWFQALVQTATPAVQFCNYGLNGCVSSNDPRARCASSHPKCTMSLTSWSCSWLLCVAGVGLTTRKMGNIAKPNLVICVDESGFISMKSQTTFKTTEIKFKLNEEFDETTADDRKTKVRLLFPGLFCFFTRRMCFQTLVTLENGKLIQKQTWDGKTTTLEREILDGKLTAVSPEPAPESFPQVLCPWSRC